MAVGTDQQALHKQVMANFRDPSLPVVCVQGLGFVGSAMALAVASARDADAMPRYNVIGVDLPQAQAHIDAINQGRFPYAANDPSLATAASEAQQVGNCWASSEIEVYALADIVIVDINLDLTYSDTAEPQVDLTPFREAMRSLAQRVRAGTLVLVETTVPPGTCAHVVYPIFEAEFMARGLAPEDICLAHSYERVMPGKDYFRSIIEFWRVFAGYDETAADRCQTFLESIIDVDRFPLTRLHHCTASETAKVLENSYRATNIAFIEEWGRFAEAVGIDLFSVIEAIRVRPTHSNIRQPGFGVGGYCLTKDPLFAKYAAKAYFELEGHDFPFCSEAVLTNRRMPLVSLEKLVHCFAGHTEGKRVLLLGASYRQDVGDTRFSPAQTFVDAARGEGMQVDIYDPLMDWWPELGEATLAALPSAGDYDGIVFAVAHAEFQALSLSEWLGDARPVLIDANAVLTRSQLVEVAESNCPFAAIGRGSYVP